MNFTDNYRKLTRIILKELNEEDVLENLKRKIFPPQSPYSVDPIFTKKRPSIPSLPRNGDEFRRRFEEYETDKEVRKSMFLRKTLEGYSCAREMYINSVILIFFVVMNPFERIKEVFEEYDYYMHKGNYKKIVISCRKIAECDYYLGLFNEGMSICLSIKEIVLEHAVFPDVIYPSQKNPVSPKMMKLTYGMMSRIMMEKGKLESAKEYIEKGLELQPGNRILEKIGVELTMMVKMQPADLESFSRYQVVNEYGKRLGNFKSDTFPIEFPLGEKYRDEEYFVDDLLDERVNYVLNEEVMKNQNMKELMVFCKVCNQQFLVWKSFFC